MSLRDVRHHIGRVAIVGFTGHAVPADLRELVDEFDLGGVVYFARNVVEPRQVADLSREVASLARQWPLWISVDQEGGRVARLRAPFTEWPPAMTLGRSGDEGLAARFAGALAAELRAVGINLVYAPVMDVRSNPANRVIGDRALADRAGDVARLGAVIIRTLQEAGVAACGKHFPGHGDTTADSHVELPVIEHDRRRLDEVELVPFRRAIGEGVAAIITAHVLVPALDERRPATLAPGVLQGLLKDTMGFDGMLVSDDLGMKAVSAGADLATIAVDAVAAGCDALLFCNSTVDEQVAALEAMIRAVESGRIAPTRIEDAFRRQHRVKVTRLGDTGRSRPALDVVGSAEHQGVAREMARWQ